MSLIASLFSKQELEKSAPFSSRELYDELYGEQLRKRVEELRSIGRYLPEMKKPHWSQRNLGK